jgi:hypothetical protein
MAEEASEDGGIRPWEDEGFLLDGIARELAGKSRRVGPKESAKGRGVAFHRARFVWGEPFRVGIARCRKCNKDSFRVT